MGMFVNPQPKWLAPLARLLGYAPRYTEPYHLRVTTDRGALMVGYPSGAHTAIEMAAQVVTHDSSMLDIDEEATSIQVLDADDKIVLSMKRTHNGLWEFV